MVHSIHCASRYTAALRAGRCLILGVIALSVTTVVAGPTTPGRPVARLGTPIGVDEPAATQPNTPAPAVSALSIDAYVEQVLARNPSLQQMIAAWQAAAA